jgi:predicted nucleic acid-binding protein
MTVADTDVLIDFLADRGASARVADELARGVLHTTVISRFELLTGARSPEQQKQSLDLLAAIPVLPLDEAAADQAASIRRRLDQSGYSIPMADCLIAGIVLYHGGELLTRNRRHFERIPGLSLSLASP